jgi:glucose/arabinose dehydrogenase
VDLRRCRTGLAVFLLAGCFATGAFAADAPVAPEKANTTAADAPAPAAAPAAATPAAPAVPLSSTTDELKSLDERIQDTKSEVIQLNRDLMVLEEELLFPANTQVAVFVSMDVGALFDLDSVQVKIDDKNIANYLYTPGEVAALHRGGVQRLYLGNLRAGPHELVALFTGKGPHDRDYRRGTTVKFEKGTDPRYIELQIKDSTGALQPEFSVKVWQ